MNDDAQTVLRFLSRVRIRGSVVVMLRALALALGVTSFVAALGAFLIGARGGVAGQNATLFASTAAFIAVLWHRARDIGSLRKGGAARLVARVKRDLVSQLESAFELAVTPNAAALGSTSLALAHQRAVRSQLSSLSVASLFPEPWWRDRSVLLGFVLALTAACLVFTTDRGASGLWSLTHGERADEHGEPLASVFEVVEVRLKYPDYLGRERETQSFGNELQVPSGTTVELIGRSRIATDAIEMRVGARAARLELESGLWTGRFVAREDASIEIRIREASEGVFDSAEPSWVRDAAVRRVRVVADRPPTVSLLVPEADIVVDPEDIVPVAWRADDDLGIAAVQLVIRAADGEERKRRISAPDPRAREAEGNESASLQEVGARAGDRLELWVEAIDGDDVSGPNVGRSLVRTLTVTSEATRREHSLEQLSEVSNLAVDTLADHLEDPSLDAATHARTRELVAALQRLHRERRAAHDRDAALFADAATRLTQAISAVSRASAGSASRERAVAHMIEELEKDVLLLADLLARGRVEDAAAIARELEALRREIASLLSELRRNPSPEARARLLGAIARAEQRLSQLTERMMRMGSSVPPEFQNASQEDARRSQDALSRMREALERDDLEDAHRALTGLEQRIDALSQMLGQEEQAFVEEHFGPRERAFAEALDQLMGLEAEQRAMSERTEQARESAADRALSGFEGRSAVANELARRAESARQSVDPIDGSRMSTSERESLENVEQRLRDATDALRTGDLGEASRMVERARDESAALARDLELDAMMFPGHDGQTARSARAARDVAHRVSELSTEIARSLPSLESHLTPGERAQLRTDAARQRTAREAAERLAQAFAEGPAGAPLSPEAAETLQQIAGTMSQGADALEREHAADAARSQEDAARRLTELRESVEQNMQQSPSGGDQGSDSSGSEASGSVRIHDSSEFEGPMEQRRRVLDAMHSPAPSGWQDMVERYYQGLLR